MGPPIDQEIRFIPSSTNDYTSPSSNDSNEGEWNERGDSQKGYLIGLIVPPSLSTRLHPCSGKVVDAVS